MRACTSLSCRGTYTRRLSAAAKIGMNVLRGKSGSGKGDKHGERPRRKEERLCAQNKPST